MHVLITGGAGCIGSDLASRLLSAGESVTVVDDLSSGKIEHIEPLLSHPDFRFINADLLNPATAKQAVQGVDFVHHLAANPDVKFAPGDPTDKDLQQNVIVTYNLLEAMRQAGVRRLAFSSTSAVYGIVRQLPISEDQPMRPISLYGATKMGCEGLISAFQNLFDMQCWIFRYANIVGAKVRKRGRTVISDFIHRLHDNPRFLLILGDGKQAKSYLRTEECIDAMLFAIDNARGSMNVFNLGCDDWVSVDRIAEMVVRSMGIRDTTFEYTGTEGGWPGDVPRFRLDVSRINALGWKARLNSEQAVERTIAELLSEMKPACRP